MTTPRPTPFHATTPRAGILILFVIISDSDDEIATLPIGPAPSSPDDIPALSGYPWDSSNDSSNEDLSETTESLHTQTASTSVVHSPPTRTLPTNPVFARRPGKEIPTSPPSPIPSASSPPLLLPSSSSPPSRLPSLSQHIELDWDDIKTLRASLASAMQETTTLRARAGFLEQHDVVTQDSLRIARGRITWSQLRAVYTEQEVRELQEFRVTDKLEIIELCSQAEYAESHLEQSHDRKTGDGARTQRTDTTE
nr:hypothetical protein [Tanacetum cinerariifolium]